MAHKEFSVNTKTNTHTRAFTRNSVKKTCFLFFYFTAIKCIVINFWKEEKKRSQTRAHERTHDYLYALSSMNVHFQQMCVYLHVFIWINFSSWRTCFIIIRLRGVFFLSEWKRKKTLRPMVRSWWTNLNFVCMLPICKMCGLVIDDVQFDLKSQSADVPN